MFQFVKFCILDDTMAPVNFKEHPVVLQSYKNKQACERMLHISRFIFKCFCFSLVLYMDMVYEITGNFFEIKGRLYWCIQAGILSLLGLNLFMYAIKYVNIRRNGLIEITEDQKRLLGIQNSETGYKSPVLKKQPKTSNVNASIISPSSFCVSSAAAVNCFSPFTSRHSRGSSLVESAANSPMTASVGQNQSMNTSSFGNPNVTSSPLRQSLGAIDSPARSDGGSILRSRSLNTSLRRSPGYTEDSIADMKDFSQLLKEQEDSSAHGSILKDANESGQSFWSFNRNVTDFSPMLRKYAYQIASRSPASSKKKTDDADDAGDSAAAEELWKLSGLFCLSHLMERLLSLGRCLRHTHGVELLL